MDDSLPTKLNSKQPGELTTANPGLLPNISAGLIIGILQIFLALSFAALIFSGQLSPFVAQGIGLGLVGMISPA